MNPLDKNDECDFAKYFKELGYGYAWDFSRRDGLYWHELYDSENNLVLQVDMSVPLKRIIADMCAVEEVDNEYFLAGEPDGYKEICNLVRAHEQKSR